jgi:hypothetical protein
MNNGKKAIEGRQTGKRYGTTTFWEPTEIKRLLKPFKGVCAADLGDHFSNIEGGIGNA